jgi:hypothetical protein
LQRSGTDTGYASQIFEINSASSIFLDEALDAAHKKWRDRCCRGL